LKAGLFLALLRAVSPSSGNTLVDKKSVADRTSGVFYPVGVPTSFAAEISVFIDSLKRFAAGLADFLKGLTCFTSVSLIDSDCPGIPLPGLARVPAAFRAVFLVPIDRLKFRAADFTKLRANNASPPLFPVYRKELARST